MANGPIAIAIGSMVGKGIARSGIGDLACGAAGEPRRDLRQPVVRCGQALHMSRAAFSARVQGISAMAPTSNRLLDEFARLVTDAAGAAQGVRREVETVVKGQAERFLKDMDVATREEVEVLRDMVTAGREENERLTARLAALEARVATLEGVPPRPGSNKAASSPGSNPQ